MFVVFEGIDGSGKTTLSNRVAQALRRLGLAVAHVREGGELASTTARSIRALGRDARHVELTPWAELLLYVARDVQLFEEATRPALGRADLVIADRYLYSAEVLACHGRGLPAAEVGPLVRGAARGALPELVVLIDIDPHVARARRRVARLRQAEPRPGSRKGLAGAGLQQRLRRGYLELAAREPSRWIVADNSGAELDALERWLVALLRRGHRAGPAAAVEEARARPFVAADGARAAPATPAEALIALRAWIERRARREPDLAAYFLGGLAGPPLDELRRRLGAASPAVIAHGLRGLADPASWQLRHELAPRVPGRVARSLVAHAGAGAEAARLREALAPIAPADVAASLAGRDDPTSWALRDRLYASAPDAVVASLERLGTPRAWALRERWLAERGGVAGLDPDGGAAALCEGLGGLDDERAWALRERAREAAPIAALDSLRGLRSARAFRWRSHHLARATRVVLRTLGGLDDPRAWALRETAAATAKEALDSMIGLDGAAAWRLRDGYADLWPSTTAKSLGLLARTARGGALLLRQLALHHGDLSLWRHAAAAALDAGAPAPGGSSHDG